MKAQQPDHEKRLKETILAHRVPFEEQAWDAMDALLDGESGKKAPAEAPAPQETPLRKFKQRRFFILLFLFSAVAVFSAKLGMNMLENTRTQATSTTPSGKLKKGRQDATWSSGGSSATTAAEKTVENLRKTAGATAAETAASAAPKTSAATQNGQKTNPTERRLGNAVSTTVKRATDPDRGWALGPAKKAASGGSSTSGENPVVPGNTGAAIAAPQNQVLAAKQADELTGSPIPVEQPKTLDNLAFLTLLPPDSLKTDRDLPEVASVPVKNKTRRNLQRGWILGANLGFVDYHPFRLSLMPIVGYHVSLPAQKGFVQTGVQVTGSTGYNQKTEFIYSAPGGTLDIDVSLDNLMFIEVPLVYQRAFAGNKRQFWLAGIRPAVVVPMNNYVSNANLINSNSLFPYANIDLRDGVRWFDVGLTAGWQWRFSECWALDVRYTQGLMDLTHDNFFNNTKTTLNSDFQLTFRHYVNTFK